MGDIPDNPQAQTPPQTAAGDASPSPSRISRRTFLLGLVGVAAAGAATWGGIAWYRGYRKELPKLLPPDRFAAVPPITDEVRIATFGDWGSGDRSQSEVLTAVDSTGAAIGGYHAGLLLGDNFYMKGVKSVDDPYWNERFKEQFGNRANLGKLTWHAILGNHDWQGNVQAQIDYTPLSDGLWHMPAHYYRQDFGPPGAAPLLTVLAIDTDVNYMALDKGREWEAQFRWLEEQLANLQGAPQHVVVAGHHTIYSYSTHGDEQHVSRVLKPLLNRYRPALYICGHDHNMQMIEMNGIGYAVVGSGGKHLYPVRSGTGTVFQAKVFGFGVLRATRQKLALDFYAAEGAKKLYTWQREKQG